MQQAITLFARMTEVEKINVRSASDDRLDYLANTAHLSDLPNHTFDERCQVLKEVAAIANLDFTVRGQVRDFSGVTWRF